MKGLTVNQRIVASAKLGRPVLLSVNEVQELAADPIVQIQAVMDSDAHLPGDLSDDNLDGPCVVTHVSLRVCELDQLGCEMRHGDDLRGD